MTELTWSWSWYDFTFLFDSSKFCPRPKMDAKEFGQSSVILTLWSWKVLEIDKCFKMKLHIYTAFLFHLTCAYPGVFLPVLNAPIYDIDLKPDTLHLKWQIDYEKEVIVFEVAYLSKKDQFSGNVPVLDVQ